MALRRRDLRKLQQALVPLGLSSLGRCEAHFLASLEAVLNKGPFIPDTISILDEMLVRMEAHHRKKMATFRALHSWDHLWLADKKAAREGG